MKTNFLTRWLFKHCDWRIDRETYHPTYWIGGRGKWADSSNWVDSTNWALTSGGKPGRSIPSAVSDVYFDDNSFSSEHSEVTTPGMNATIHKLSFNTLKKFIICKRVILG